MTQENSKTQSLWGFLDVRLVGNAPSTAQLHLACPPSGSTFQWAPKGHYSGSLPQHLHQ